MVAQRSHISLPPELLEPPLPVTVPLTLASFPQMRVVGCEESGRLGVGVAQCIPAPFKMPILLNKGRRAWEEGFVLVRQALSSSFVIKM